MQRENGESETGLDKNNRSQQELMLHYQLLAGFFTSSVFLLAVEMQREKKAWKLSCSWGDLLTGDLPPGCPQSYLLQKVTNDSSPPAVK